MKKLLIILLLLFAVSSQAQIDTASWSLQRDGLGHYSMLTNRVTFAGVGAGHIRIPLILSLSEIDTSTFQLIRDGYGNYSVAINKASLYGIDSGKIRIGITYDVSEIRLNEANTWTAPQTYSKIFVDSLVLRLYLLDTGTSIVRNILPQTTRLYSLGGGSNYWLNQYTQNLYVDTVKKSVVADSMLTTASYKQKTVVAIADSVINCNFSNTFSKTLSANQRFVIENIGDGQTVNIAVTNTAGNYTVTWIDPAGLTIKWSGGTAPVATIGEKTDIWTFVRIGTTIYGNVSQNY